MDSFNSMYKDQESIFQGYDYADNVTNTCLMIVSKLRRKCVNWVLQETVTITNIRKKISSN